MQFHRQVKNRSRREVELNFASMIDVVFLLLVFFIATSTIARPESRLSPALQTKEDNQTNTQADFTPQVIKLEVIDGTPVYILGGRILYKRTELVDLLKALPKELGIFVEVADNIPFGFTASAIQCTRDAGFDKVTYVPQKEG